LLGVRRWSLCHWRNRITASRRLIVANTPHEQESLKRQIDATDRQIDKLVYELYVLTDEEIGIVEGQ